MDLPSSTTLLICAKHMQPPYILLPSLFQRGPPSSSSKKKKPLFQTELFWSPVQFKIQITGGLTGRPIPTDPAPSFPELPHRISTVYSPSAFHRRGRGGICYSKIIQKEQRRKYNPLARISVGWPLLGVSATCCAQLAKYTAMRNSLGWNRLVYK